MPFPKLSQSPIAEAIIWLCGVVGCAGFSDMFFHTGMIVIGIAMLVLAASSVYFFIRTVNYIYDTRNRNNRSY